MTHGTARRAPGTTGWRPWAGLAVASAGLLLGVATVSASPGKPSPGPGADANAGTSRGAIGRLAADIQVTEAGRALYQANCASCHGQQGSGTADGPSLVGVGAASADFYLRTGRMPLSAPGQHVVRQAPHFDEAGIQALVAYVASLGQGPDIPQVTGNGDVSRGWALFQANCAACHNATGSGNAVGGGFVAVGLANANPVTVGEATLIGPGAMPAFKFDKASLEDLATYIRWLRDAPTPGGAAIGQTGPVAEGFVGVAVGLPLLLLAAWFVARNPLGHRKPASRTLTTGAATGTGAPGETVDATETAAMPEPAAGPAGGMATGSTTVAGADAATGRPPEPAAQEPPANDDAPEGRA